MRFALKLVKLSIKICLEGQLPTLNNFDSMRTNIMLKNIYLDLSVGAWNSYEETLVDLFKPYITVKILHIL